jgi:alpha-galactosidase
LKNFRLIIIVCVYSWGRERYVVESKLIQGTLSFGSVRGVSSHQHNPFIAISFGHPSETVGEVRAMSLLYSGNFLVEVEQAELGRLRINMGIHPMGLEWNLRKGETFSTPEAVLVRSSEGLGGMSRTLHRLFLERLIPHNWSDERPPILLNTWEAKYFHVSHENVLEMAEKVIFIFILHFIDLHS